MRKNASGIKRESYRFSARSRGAWRAKLVSLGDWCARLIRDKCSTAHDMDADNTAWHRPAYLPGDFSIRFFLVIEPANLMTSHWYVW